MRFYVYELLDPRSGRPFYVGKGQGNRINHHEKEARSGHPSAKCCRIREIEALGLAIGKRKVKTFQQERDALRAEAALIAKHGIGSLTNVQAPIVRRPSPVTRRPAGSLKDEKTVLCAAQLMARFRGVPVFSTRVTIGDAELDFVGALKSWRKRVDEIIATRGSDWVNQIARKHGVRFV